MTRPTDAALPAVSDAEAIAKARQYQSKSLAWTDQEEEEIRGVLRNLADRLEAANAREAELREVLGAVLRELDAEEVGGHNGDEAATCSVCAAVKPAKAALARPSAGWPTTTMANNEPLGTAQKWDGRSLQEIMRDEASR